MFKRGAQSRPRLSPNISQLVHQDGLPHGEAVHQASTGRTREHADRKPRGGASVLGSGRLSARRCRHDHGGNGNEAGRSVRNSRESRQPGSSIRFHPVWENEVCPQDTSADPTGKRDHLQEDADFLPTVHEQWLKEVRHGCVQGRSEATLPREGSPPDRHATS